MQHSRLPLALLLVSFSCGGSSSVGPRAVSLLDEGSNARTRRDFGAARARFEAALPLLVPGTEEFRGAPVGSLQAAVHEDAGLAAIRLADLQTDVHVRAENLKLLLGEYIDASHDSGASAATIDNAWVAYDFASEQFPGKRWPAPDSIRVSFLCATSRYLCNYGHSASSCSTCRAAFDSEEK